MGFRITTWNGLILPAPEGIKARYDSPRCRNPFGYQPWREKRSFQSMFEILEADIVVMQETKIQRKDLSDDMVLVPGWDVYFSLPRHKKGYSGVAIYTKNATCAPIRAEEGVTGTLCPPKSTTQFRNLPKDQQIGGYPRPGQLSGNIDELLLDSEGRCVILEFPGFVLLGVYSPANRDESRVEFRMEFLEALDIRIRNLIAEGKQVFLTGDLNVTRSEIDSTNIAENIRKEGLTMDEWKNMPSRRLFNHLVFGGEVQGDRDEGREQPVLWDLCRLFHPNREGMNTCWDTKRNTRPANNGSRIDYVLCSDGLKDWFTHANIQEGLMGSDHCPVFAMVANTVMVSGIGVPFPDLVNPPGMFKDGSRMRDWSPKDILPLSAKLIPEFDRRQSIRDMFARKPSPSTSRQSRSNPQNFGRSDTQLNFGSDSSANKIERKTTEASDIFTVSATAHKASKTPSTSKRLAPFVDPILSSTSSSSSSKRSKVSPAPSPKMGLGRGGGVKEKPNLVTSSGQKTLQGFFKPVTSTSTTCTEANTNNNPSGELKQMPGPLSTHPVINTPTETAHPHWQSKVLHPIQEPRPSSETPTHQTQDKVFDPVQAKESWSRLLGKRVLPRCEHNEPCISLITKKPGVNCGKYRPPFVPF
ncbi:DNA-(apurinic or apyrimidinic site) endonuclease 2 [Cladobotryum mycophilum]|uniref:DNA-(Apurinic or apyrimidinic site) endonuclease 2 n=1 Tax=Cladobotryum mycophilum TaxID=491253 RepID=A0ABR0T4M6_9HYPO